ncbi:EF-hand domain-containing protein [Methylobacillus methanolivorans]|uniref:EF-hand domain-containing protein n=1 Tax=Methylobacillus methanolivorans TaxID=1848927 RepID=A0ABW8GJC8_9PROT
MISSISGSASQIASSIFGKLDTSNKGYIEQADLQSALSKINGNDDSSDTDELFSSLDSDSDGKLTESELSSGISNLLSELNSQFNNSRVQGGMPPPPPPQGEEDDEGYTQDELESIASSTNDSQLSSLMSTIAANFEAADTNKDGKVSAKEAMEYQRQNEGNQAKQPEDNSINRQIGQLIAAYGSSDDTSSTSNSLSLAA